MSIYILAHLECDKGKASGYRGHDMKEKDHEKFITACLKLRGMAIVSGYDHMLYNPLTEAGWKKIVIPWKVNSTNHTSRGSSVAKKANEKRNEILWLSPNIRPAQNTLF